MKSNDFAIRLAQHRTIEGYTFDCQSMAGEVGADKIEVWQIEMHGFDGFPMFVTETQHQIICIIYLWTDAEVKAARRVEMLEVMLDTSISIPLSSYARIDEHYVLYGALSVHSGFEKIVEELVTLNENAADVVMAMEDFLL